MSSLTHIIKKSIVDRRLIPFPSVDLKCASLHMDTSVSITSSNTGKCVYSAPGCHGEKMAMIKSLIPVAPHQRFTLFLQLYFVYFLFYSTCFYNQRITSKIVKLAFYCP